MWASRLRSRSFSSANVSAGAAACVFAGAARGIAPFAGLGVLTGPPAARAADERQRDDAVHAVAAGDHLDDLLGYAVRDGGDEVDRVASAPERRQQLVDRRDHLRRQLRELEPVCREEVGGQHAPAAAEGDDGDAAAGGQRLVGEQRGGVERFVGVGGEDDTGLPGGGAEDLGRAGQRAGVGAGRPAPERAQPAAQTITGLRGVVARASS